MVAVQVRLLGLQRIQDDHDVTSSSVAQHSTAQRANWGSSATMHGLNLLQATAADFERHGGGRAVG